MEIYWLVWERMVSSSWQTLRQAKLFRKIQKRIRKITFGEANDRDAIDLVKYVTENIFVTGDDIGVVKVYLPRVMDDSRRGIEEP